MKRFFLLLFSAVTVVASFAQKDLATPNTRLANAPKVSEGTESFTVIKSIPATPVKDQSATGTCWSFSTTSLIESQAMKNNTGELDLSEMFTVRNIYIEKAKNYVLRQGHAQFSEGGLGHDQIRAIALYGAMPENVYSGLKNGQQAHNHQRLIVDLQAYLDDLVKRKPLPDNWMKGFKAILDSALGTPPEKFASMGITYTPQSYAKNILQFNANDYVNITSFTHHPYYESFVLEVPDNFSNGAYYNLPLDEMIKLTKDALTNGYSVLWDADVSNAGFIGSKGMAVGLSNDPGKVKTKEEFLGGAAEEKWDAETRQKLFENLTTQDDHLMHITGLERSSSGKTFFLVKNSWGMVGPYKGYINVSEAYFAINTISLVVPKAALSKAMLEKLKIK